MSVQEALIGAMLYEPSVSFPLIVEAGITHEWFDGEHRTIVQKLLDDWNSGRTIDPVIVCEEMLRQGHDAHDLVTHCLDITRLGSCPLYVSEMVDRHLALTIEQVCLKSVSDIASGANVYSVASSMMDGLSKITDNTKTESHFEYLDKANKQWQEALKQRVAGVVVSPPGIKTPWEEINRATGGLREGITIVAAAPSVGKTVFEDMLMTHIAMTEGPVARVQLDMGATILPRSVCRIAETPLNDLERGSVDYRKMSEVQDAIATVKGLPINYLIGISNIQIIVNWIRQMKMKHGIVAFSVDYIQIVDAEASSDNSRITKISSALKNLSRELDIPGVVLSQLSRDPAKQNRPPTLRDLRDSGSLEQDAACVYLLSREQDIVSRWELENGWRYTQRWDAIVVDRAKMQNGPTGKMRMINDKPIFSMQTCDENWKLCKEVF